MSSVLSIKIYNQLHKEYCATFRDVDSAKLFVNHLVFAKEKWGLKFKEECFDLIVKCRNGTLYTGFELESTAIFDKIIDKLSNGCQIDEKLGEWRPEIVKKC